MTHELRARMIEDANTYWWQSMDWLAVVTAMLHEMPLVARTDESLCDLRRLCDELSPYSHPTDTQVEQLRRLASVINPQPSPETEAKFPRQELEQTMGCVVERFGGCEEALRLRRTTLAYGYLSHILEGITRTRNACGPHG